MRSRYVHDVIGHHIVLELDVGYVSVDFEGAYSYVLRKHCFRPLWLYGCSLIFKNMVFLLLFNNCYCLL